VAQSGQGVDIYVVFDGDPDTEFARYIRSKPIKEFVGIDHRDNEKSLLSCLELAARLDFEHVYFLEDDYLHTDDAMAVLLEGLRAHPDHIISLYDHPDRYTRGDDLTKDRESVYVGTRGHWRTGESSTCTMAMGRDLFLKVKPDLERFGVRDRDLFRHLLQKNIRLISPLPGRSTHVHRQFLSPLMDWQANNDRFLP
jgi:hypothetical protein